VTTAPRDLQALVEETLRGRRIATAQELGMTATLWLAAAPVWTRSAAEAAGFPVESVPDFVRRAGEAGWCETRGSARGQGSRELRFWMPDAVRREVIGAVISQVGYESAAELVTRIAIDLAPRVRLPGALPGIQSPGSLRAWTDLAGHASPGERAGRLNVTSAADRLVEQARNAVEAGDIVLAQDLADAGEAVAAIFGGTAEQALSRARRLLALGLQRRQDERALSRYLDRPELSDAVGRLLQPEPEHPWALHLRGVGGVGKTMLIRYLASGRYARDRGIAPIPVARADFDHLSPDYPVRRPVQLLLELADELALHAAGNYQADQALAAFRARAARAHEAVSGLREAGAPPLGNPEVARAVDDFAAVLRSLGGVLLILDTCEELAKADMGNPAAPAVRGTLDILERLHDKAPSARVLLAGRRPLPERAYLVVQPVAGFTVAEARRYLARDHVPRRSQDAAGGEPADSRPLPPQLADAMIGQSPAVDGPVPAEGRLPERVSPFDLALYAAWAQEDPELSVAQVSQGSDAYIEGRIIERLDDPLVIRALPVLASAGRCRVATIAGLLNCDAAALGASLAALEWIEAAGSPAAGSGHVAAAPALARRLRRYFGREGRRAEFAARNAALASFLLPRLRATPLADIDVDELIAALRMSAPAEAAALWDSIAGQAAQPPGRWGTVANMTRRILGEWEPGEPDADDWPTQRALRATVTAAHIAASRRDSPLLHPRRLWETVRDWAGAHPDPAMRRLLAARATLGLPGGPSGQARPQRPRITRPELAAAAADALHRLLEAGDARAAAELAATVVDDMHAYETGSRSATGIFDSEDDSYPAWMQATVRVRAWAYVASARLVADSDPAAARRELESAGRLAATATGPEPAWPDWIPPDDLRARIWIEHGLIAPPAGLLDLEQWESYAAEHVDSIDGERLASLCLRIRLRHGVVDASVARRWEALDSYSPGRVPVSSAHDLVPPLCVSVAEAWMSAGEPDHAMDYLSGRTNQARGSRHDEATARLANAATMKIVRRLRLRTQNSLLYRLAGASGFDDGIPADVRQEAWRTIALLGERLGLRPQEVDSPAEWHAWWQSHGLAADGTFAPGAEPEHVADIKADLEEFAQLRGRPLSGQPYAFDNWLAHTAAAAAPARSAQPYRDARAGLRMLALRGDSFIPGRGVPHRLRAEILFEEAELTALRLPHIADILFELAAGAYALADDPLGRVLALTARSRPQEGPADMLPAAREALAGRQPELAATLSGPPDDAGPWRYWAQRAQRPGAAVTVATLAFPTPGMGSTDQPGNDARPPGSGSSRPERRLSRPVIIGLAVLGACALIALIALTPTVFLNRTPHPHPTVTSTSAASTTTTPTTTTPAGNPTTSAPTTTPPTTSTPKSGPPASGSPVSSLPTFSPASPGGAGSPASPGGAGGAWAVLWALAGVAAVGVMTALAAAIRSRTSTARRLANGRGIGATRPRNLLLEAVVRWSSGDRSSVDLLARLRPWRSAPLRARVALAFLAPAVWLAARGRARPDGYFSLAFDPAAPRSPLEFVSMSGQLQVKGDWWRAARGSVPGVLRTQPLDARFGEQPWERLISEGLGRGAAGQIEWIRLVENNPYGTFAMSAMSTTSSISVLSAAEAWRREYGRLYSPRPSEDHGLIRVLHVIGRAVSTSAGPCMDTSGPGAASAAAPAGSLAVGPGAASLLGAQELQQGQPGLVVLQAEPASGAIGDAPPADQAEKLALARELALDGIPAVLLLPALPAGPAYQVAQAITRDSWGGRSGDARDLLSRLRKIVKPHVPPPVLDDIVLFLNESMYRQ
jgi:hypothetical protein